MIEPEKLRANLLEAVETLLYSSDINEREQAANQLTNFITETI